MIEVELRGPLDEKSHADLKVFMEQHGQLVERHTREMILLRDYPGYSIDPNERTTDVRLRKTNDSLEIMVKHKVSDNNVGREEVSLPLAGDWDTALKVLKGLGFSEGLWMRRNKDVYTYQGKEWSLVDATNGHYYFEVEQEATEGEDLEAIQQVLAAEAAALDLTVFNPKEMRDFIYMLDKAVNKDISW